MVAMLPGRPKINNWAFETVPQPGLNGRRGYQPSGRALGGSSAINAMLYVRGHPSDYDDWAGRLRRMELVRCAAHLPPLRGQCPWRGRICMAPGPLQVAEQRTPRPISHAFVDAAVRFRSAAMMISTVRTRKGRGLFQVTQFWQDGKQGERCSAAAAYLHPVMTRPNLTVITGAHATRC
jgi:choline dehydrogenase-like flavoprotein